jgi:hypothetical protein
MTFYVGQDITVTLTATNLDGSPAEPAGVRFRLKAPGIDALTFELGSDDEVTSDDDGMTYRFTFDAAAPGRYDVRAETLNGADEVVSATEQALLVARSRVLT